MRKLILLTLVSASLVSCWKFNNNFGGGTTGPGGGYTPQKIMGYKPLYAADPVARQVLYSPNPQIVVTGGNIYAFQNYIFQLDPGRGIHVIDNSVPASAHRIGFISVKGCS
jgi:hypothetical protein